MAASIPSSPAEPFVLVDCGVGAEALLFRAPVEIVVARRGCEVGAALERVGQLAAEGRWCAGYLAYEAGLAIEQRLAGRVDARAGADGPLVWFGAFAGREVMAGDDVAGWLAGNAGGAARSGIGPLEPQLSPGGYARAFAALAGAIDDGDIYQANFTMPLAGHWRGDPLAIYAGLRGAGGGQGAVVFDGSHWLLSCSPELFFSASGGEVVARPMKGTRPRGRDPAEDALFAAELAASPKDRAENLMILDLMRNDCARVAVPGSVRVEAPFAIESYATVHQMVSTVRARLAAGVSMVDLVRALFPCGSVTGAPKIRAMELIDGHEIAPRGPSCGAIGYIGPGEGGEGGANRAGEAAFNVAIRTLRLAPDGSDTAGGSAVLGVGSAIVSDSRAMAEWRECLVKGSFVHQPTSGQTRAMTGGQEAGVARFDLIETMRFTPEDGIALLELHLARIGASAAALGFVFDRHGARNAIQALCFEAEAPSKLRLLCARGGAIALEIAPLTPSPDADAPVSCAVLPLPLDSGDWRLAHKTSERWHCEAGLAVARAAGAGEALFIRDDGLLTEGSWSSLFIERDGLLVTPPAGLGLLPGVLRAKLIDEGRAIEAELRYNDLAGGFLIGNALRGLMRARLLG